MRNFVLFLLLLSSVAAAQSNFKPASISLQSGDSVKGTIDDQHWRRNPTSIKFIDASNKEQIYYPGSIKGFVINGRVSYESHLVKYDTASETVKRISFSPLPSNKEKTVFLKALVRGKATLYVMVEDNDRIHYFIGKDDKVVELLNHRFLENNHNIRSNRQYIEQLKTAFSDCASIKINPNLRYDEGSLVKLFEKYATCTGSEVVVTKREKALIRPGVIGAISWDQLGGYPPFPASTGFGAGVFVNSILPGKMYKWSVYAEVAYRKFGDQISSYDPKLVEISSLKVTAMARNHFNVLKVRSFVNAGVSYSAGLTDKIVGTVQSGEFNAKLISIVGGVGSILNYNGKGPKVIIDARIEYGNGPASFYPRITKHVSSSLNVGIQF